MKTNLFIILSAFFLAAFFVGCGGGEKTNESSIVTPTVATTPASAKQDNYSTSITPVMNKSVVAITGGTVEVVIADNILKGRKLTIPAGALSQNTNISVGSVNNPPALPVGLNFVGVPTSFGPSGTTFVVPATLKIPFTIEDLKQAGVESKTGLKLYAFNEATKTWSEEKIISIDTAANIVTGQINHFSFHALAGLSGMPPKNLGTPQPGDLLYRLSTFDGGKTSGWIPGHVGIYTGEKVWEGDNEKFASPDVIRCKKFNVVEALIGQGVIYSYYKIPNTTQSCEVEKNFQGNSVYMGARESAEFSLTTYERNMGVKFAIGQVGKPYATDQSLGVLFGMLKGISVKGLMVFNCVGLSERMYEEYGANNRQGIVIDDNDKLLTPADQYSKTKPAGSVDAKPIIGWATLSPSSGTSSAIVVAQIAITHPNGLGEIDSVRYVTDDGYMNPQININDKGIAGDDIAGDGVYSCSGTIAGDSSKGSMGMTFTITDKSGKTDSIRLIYTYKNSSGWTEIAPKIAISEQLLIAKWGQ